MQIITAAVQKGGVGKTTTGAALLQAAKVKGLRALAVDLDQQGNLTYMLHGTAANKGSFELLSGEPARELIKGTPQGIDLIPASMGLTAITTEEGSARRLARALEPIKKYYDLIFIDTPASEGELKYNALMAATGLIIPMFADVLSIQGLYQVMDTAKAIQKANIELSILGIVITRYSGRTNAARYYRDQAILKANGLGARYLGTIRESVTITEAIGLQQNLFEYAPKSKPAEDYTALFEALKIGGKNETRNNIDGIRCR